MSIQAGTITDSSQYLDQITGDAAPVEVSHSNGVTLPDTEFLLRGDYSRDGDDLRVTKESGDVYVVRDYFTGDSPPTLYAPNGAGLTFDTVAKLVGAQIGGVADPVMVAGPADGAAVIGTVRSLRGAATAKGADGQVRQLAKGDPIYLNDAVETADGSFLRLTFEDGTAFFLGRNARAVIDEYVYKPEAEEGSFAASVAVGFFRYISGKLGKLGSGDKPHSSIKTPTATIGIRGSDIEGEVDETGNTTLVHHSGVIDVADINGLGMVTLLVPGSATVVSPEGVAAIFQAPPEMMQRFQQNLPPPSNGDAPPTDQPGEQGEAPPAQQAEGEQPPAGPAEDGGEEGGEAPAAEGEDGGEPDGEEEGEGAEEEGDGPEGRERREGDEPEEGPDDGPEAGEEPGDRPPLFGEAREGGEPREPGEGPEEEGERIGLPDQEPPEEFVGRGPEPGEEFDEGGPIPGDGPEEGPVEGALFDGAPPPEEGGQEGMFEPAHRQLLADYGDVGELSGEDPAAPDMLGLEGGLVDGSGFDGGEPPLGEEPLNEPMDEPMDEPQDEPLPPVTIDAVDDFYEITGGDTLYANMLANDWNFAPDRVFPHILGYTPPAHGDLRVGEDGTFAYTPHAGYQGFDAFTYVVGDGFGNQYPAVVHIEVTGSQIVAPPIDDYFAMTAGEPLHGDVLANDRALAPADVQLQVVHHSVPGNGTLVLNADGSFTYTPFDGFSGFDSFTYVVEAGPGIQFTGWVEIEVSAASSGGDPVDLDDYYYTEANVPFSGNVIDNDWLALPSGAAPTIIDHGEPANGTLVMNADGSFTYTPNAGYSGFDGFTYLLGDGFGDIYSAFVEISVGGVVAPGGGLDDYFRVPLDAPFHAGLLGNDRVELGAGANPVVIDYTLPTDGQLTVSADGRFDYTPNAGFVGIDSFTYTASDGLGGTYMAFVGLDVGGYYADNPLSLDDEYNVTVDQPFTANLLINDLPQLPAGSTPEVVSHTQPGNGSVIVAADGTFTYTPAAGYAGFDFFSYTLADGLGGRYTALVELNVGGGLPVEGLDDRFTAESGVEISGNILVNDALALPAAASLTVADFTQPANGTLTLNIDGSFRYTSNPDFAGSDYFSYVVDDGLGGHYPAYVEILVGGGYPAGDIDDYYVTDVDTPYSANVIDNDWSVLPAGATPTVVDHSAPYNGTLILNADGSFTYTPNAGYSGPDDFRYVLEDGLGGRYEGWVQIDVGTGGYPPTGGGDDVYTVAIDAPFSANVLDNDWSVLPAGATPTIVANSAPASGTLTLGADGGFTYTPFSGFSGLDGFSYDVDDGLGGTHTFHVALDVGGDGSLSDPFEENFTIATDEVLSFDALENDRAGLPAGAAPTVTAFTQPGFGGVAMGANGQFTYTPNAGYTGHDYFTYDVDDGLGGHYTTYVDIDIGVGGGGTGGAQYDFFFVNVDTSIADNVLNNDWAALPAGATPSVMDHTQPAHGSLTLNPDGSFVYMPSAGYIGHDSFTYTIDDGFGGISTALVDLDVSDGGATSADDHFYTPLDAPVSGDLFYNDWNLAPAGATLTLASHTQPTNGTVTVSSNGQFTYTPVAAFIGIDSFSYTVDDGLGNLHTATVTIDVGGGGTATNQIPITGYDFHTIPLDGTATGNVLLNDYDPDGDTLGALLRDLPGNGTVTLSPSGDFVYTPNAGFAGNDFFSYEANDGRGGIQVEWVEIEVGGGGGGGNTAPFAGEENYTTPEGTTLTGNVLANDYDPDGDPITAWVDLMPSNGTLTLSADGNFTYVPYAAFIGIDSFKYAVDDGRGGVTYQWVDIDVGGGGGGANNPPSAMDDYFTTTEGVSVSGNLLGNDYDMDGDLLNATLYTAPANGGTVNLTPDGNFNYTPPAGLTGGDSFQYEVSDGRGGFSIATVNIAIDAVAATNQPPMAVNDSFNVAMDTPITEDLLFNDYDPDGDPLSVISYTQPANGSVSVSAAGIMDYQPMAAYMGPDSFSYTIDDGNGHSATATVSLNVA